MNYPDSTISKPVVGEEARILVKAVESGGYVANDAARATAARILARRRSQREGITTVARIIEES